MTRAALTKRLSAMVEAAHDDPEALISALTAGSTPIPREPFPTIDEILRQARMRADARMHPYIDESDVLAVALQLSGVELPESADVFEPNGMRWPQRWFRSRHSALSPSARAKLELAHQEVREDAQC